MLSRLTPLKFEKITGHAPGIDHERHGYIAWCVCDCGGKVHGLRSGKSRTQSIALARLVEIVYSTHSRIVMDRANWKCEECGAVTGLSTHHKTFRSHGRDDRVDNLMAVCNKSHNIAHGIRRAV